MDKEMIIDMPDFMARVEDDLELARDLAEIFLSDTDGKIDKLAQHIAENNADGVRDVAHSIKGAAANLSAVSVIKFARTLEKKGESGDLTGAEQSFSGLVSTIGEFKKLALEEFDLDDPGKS